MYRRLYKQQKPLTLSSAILALIVTAIVLLLASSAHAQSNGQPVLERKAEMAAPNTAVPAPGDLRSQPNVAAENDVRFEANASSSLEVRPGTRLEELRATLRARQSTLEEKRSEWQANLVDRQTLIAEKRAKLASSSLERKAALKEDVKQRLSDMTERMSASLNQAITLLRDVTARLRTRANELKDSGVDTTATITALDQADSLLNDAAAALSGVDVNVKYALTSDTPKTDWADAREQFESTRDIIKEARGLLIDALATLKEAAHEAEVGNGVSTAVSADASAENTDSNQ